MEETQNKTPCAEEQIKIIFSKNDKIVSSKTEDMINKIIKQEVGKKLILSTIIERYKNINQTVDIVDGLVYQKIVETKDNELINELLFSLPKGIINLEKSTLINYQPLQKLLIQKSFREADKLTQKHLCELVEKQTQNTKNWLYFTDIQFISNHELFTIDLLWKTYSRGKFGFSIQKDIWIKYDQRWDKLWEKINWLDTQTGIMKRYPQDFNWTTEAPEGHLPLFNQLRGTQTLCYLFNKIDW
uniref:GUN4-like domain-containing protein n=1 Tax=Polysiphonia infestans TaxID=2006978 RepID=A0A1Z1MDY6_9FLOR|nr:hypothetical protein [Polysiphonia infestans]ARW64278.1 hypothetical protein [Polysiphonia infestans]